MLASFVLPALAALSFFSTAVAQEDVCQSAPYAQLSCLSDFPGATPICNGAPKQTITITTTTTTLDPVTIETTQHATDQTTVAVTSYQKTTITVTKGKPTTVTSTSTKHSTELATLTTYVPVDAAASGAVVAAVDATCNPREAISALGALGNGNLASACSCLGNAVPTSTETVIITAPAVKSRTTDVAGTAPTTTLFKLSIKTITETERPTKFVTETTTKCKTSTTTLSYAAPTFTQAFGPEAGCANTAAGSTQALDVSIDNARNATQECQGLCMQESTCSFVYVQELFAENDAKAHFQCSFNDHKLKQASDLDCGKNENKFGSAVGYDACSRGAEPL